MLKWYSNNSTYIYKYKLHQTNTYVHDINCMQCNAMQNMVIVGNEIRVENIIYSAKVSKILLLWICTYNANITIVSYLILSHIFYRTSSDITVFGCVVACVYFCLGTLYLLTMKIHIGCDGCWNQKAYRDVIVRGVVKRKLGNLWSLDNLLLFYYYFAQTFRICHHYVGWQHF